MKRIIIIFAAVFALSFSLDTASIHAKPYYYFVFNNLDDQMGHQSVNGSVSPIKITNMLDIYYWDLWQTREGWKEYAKFTSFGSSTFSQYPAKDMDVGVFPLGHSSTLNTSVGGVRVLDAVKEMLEAGKGVIIVGHAIFTDLNGGVDTWLTDDVGIDLNAIGRLSLMAGNTYLPYETRGTQKDDPIFGAIQVGFNGPFTVNGGDFYGPTRYYPDMHAFKLTADSKATVGALIKDTDYAVGCYKEFDNGAKLIIWSLDWPNVATNYVANLHFTYIKAIEWITDALPAPSGLLETSEDDIEFGSIVPGDSIQKTLILRNNGREDLHITDMYFWNDRESPEDPKGFHLEANEKTKFTLTPGELRKIKVWFRPIVTTDPDFDPEYSDDLVIENDGIGNGKKYISLSGTGGEAVNYGPILKMFETDISFGSILSGSVATRLVTLINDGTARLTVMKVAFDEQTEDFRYGAEYHMPAQVEPGEEFSQLLKFTPLEENKSYKTTMSVETNGNNDDYKDGIGNAKVTLTGKTVSEKKPADCILNIGKEIKFGATDSTRIDTMIVIQNPGEEVLSVYSVTFKADEEPLSADMFTWTPKGVLTINPGASESIKLTFKPLENGEFYGNFYIESNAKGSHAKYEIFLHGEGKDVPPLESVYDEIKGITANVYPNPITANSKIELNIENNMLSNLNIKIVDIQGRTLQNVTNATYTTGTYTFDIKSESWTAGKYFVLITTDGKQTALPIIIE